MKFENRFLLDKISGLRKIIFYIFDSISYLNNQILDDKFRYNKIQCFINYSLKTLKIDFGISQFFKYYFINYLFFIFFSFTGVFGREARR